MINNSPSLWIEVLTANDDTVTGEVLDWAGLRDYWNRHEKDSGNWNIVHDVLDACPSAEVACEEWDAEASGRSGVSYVISTNDPETLKSQIRARIDELLEPTKTTPATKAALPSTVAEVAAFLGRAANRMLSLRGPAGYAGMGASEAKHLNDCAAELLNQPLSTREELCKWLIQLATTIRSESLRREILQIADTFRL